MKSPRRSKPAGKPEGLWEEIDARAPQVLRAAAVEMCRRPGGLLRFIRLMWPVVEPERRFVDGWHLEAICRHLEAVTYGQITRLLINVPPGMMKSLGTNVFWPAWEWGPMGLSTMRYMCASYSQDLTIRDNERFIRVILSDTYREAWGERVQQSKRRFSLEHVENENTGWKLATSVGGVGTGSRADRVILDDPNSVKTVESDAVRHSTNQWFREVIPTRLNDAATSAIVVIQQRTHEEDVSGIILTQEMGYEHLLIPMEYDSRCRYVSVIGWTDPRGIDDGGGEVDNDGALIWPERFPRWTVERDKKALGPYAVAGQFQQSPSPRGGGIFKRAWLQPWPEVGADGTFPQGAVRNGRIQYPALEYIVAWVDTAFTKREDNDPCAMVVLGVFRAEGKGRIERRHDGTYVRTADDYGHPKVLLLHGWQKRLEMHGPPEEVPPGVDARAWNGPEFRALRQQHWGLVEWVVDTCRRFKVDHLGIETQAAGHTLDQELRRLHSDGDWGVELVPAKGDKIARAYAVQHLFSAHQVYVPTFEDGTYPSWATPIVDDLCKFPRGAHDDIVDTITGGIKHLRETGILERRDEFDRAEEHAMSWQVNKPVPLPYDL